MYSSAVAVSFSLDLLYSISQITIAGLAATFWPLWLIYLSREAAPLLYGRGMSIGRRANGVALTVKTFHIPT